MALTADALWLNTVFAGYDMAILSFLHKLAESAGAVLTPLFKLITLLGVKGILFFLLGIVLMLFPRWRRTGLCIFGAVCCGALISNILLKDAIARPRPFEASELFRQWWQAMDSTGLYLGPADDGFTELSDGTLSFRRSVRPSHRCIFRFCCCNHYQPDLPIPRGTQR